MDNFSINIKKGSIYGLVGTNGGGKTTFMNVACGAYEPESGAVYVDDLKVHKGNLAKEKIFYVPDDAYFFQNFTVDNMAKFYKGVYSKTWSDELYNKLIEKFPIKKNVKMKSFSKGMKRQGFLILALSAQPEYLLLDEVFDGLDPVIRLAIRKIIADIVSDRNMTVIIASHNLRELEDFCDTVGLVHGGKLVLEQGLDNISCSYCKAQLAFSDMATVEIDKLEKHENILSVQKNGNFINVSARMTADELEAFVKTFKPSFAQFIPLSLEEVFINEMEAIGYDYNQIIL